MSCFPCTLLRYFLNDFEIVPVAPIIVGITSPPPPTRALYFYCRAFRLCFKIFSASFLTTFLSPEGADSINIHVSFSLSYPVYCYGWFCQFSLVGSRIWLSYIHDLVSTNFGTCTYQCFLSNFTHISLHLVKCS
jgi:hypothetical protein